MNMVCMSLRSLELLRFILNCMVQISLFHTMLATADYDFAPSRLDESKE